MGEFQYGFIQNQNLANSLLLASRRNKSKIPTANEPYGVSAGGIGDWDYQNANSTNKLGPQGQELPFRATAWDAYGRPYYGEGWDGWYAQTRGKFEDIWHGRDNDVTPVDMQRGVKEVTDAMDFGEKTGAHLSNGWAYLQNGWGWVTNHTGKSGEISIIGQLGRSVGDVVDIALNAADRIGQAGKK